MQSNRSNAIKSDAALVLHNIMIGL